jgi:flagellin
MISLQTNFASLVGQQNMNTNQIFQTKTVEALTSGYRINQSGDDAAGLAVANQYRSNIAELTQGVLNGNNGISTLQTIDGGLSNISTMLDRMKTLATESASGTFTGNRATTDQEFQNLKAEVTRQATNIGLVTGGTNANNLAVYIGGAPSGNATSSSAVNINLSTGQVDSTSLGLGKTTVGDGLAGTVLSSTAAAPDVSGASSITLAGTVTLSVATANTPLATPTTVTLSGSATGTQFVADINSQLAGTGVSADLNSHGQIEFKGGSFAISASDGTTAGADVSQLFGAASATNVLNSDMFGKTVDSAVFSPSTTVGTVTTANSAAQSVEFTVNGQTTKVAIAAGSTQDQAVASINNAMNAQGIYAMSNSTVGTSSTTNSIQFQGTGQFSWKVDAAASGTGPLGAGTTVAAAATGDNVATTSATANATSAISAINSALGMLGKVQGTVGAGENQLQYAINLANSQITNMSSAQSSIRDADVATEAANLTKAQVLGQASVAAMAQANASTQSVLKLLG